VTSDANFAKRSRRRDLLICLVLFAGTVLLFGRATRDWFISYDDQKYIYANPHVQAGLTRATMIWAFTTCLEPKAATWFPLTWLSLALDHQLFGLCPGGYHLTNILLHAANAVLLFLTLRVATGRAWPSALAAAFFAWHPLRVESVAWVTERKDVLSGFFFLATMLIYSSNVVVPARWKRILIVAAFVCGLLAKPMIMTLPLVLLLWDYWPLQRRQPIGRLIAEKIPLVVVAIGLSVPTLIARREEEGTPTLGSWAEVGKRAFLSLHSIADYLTKEAWPTNLGVLYPLRNESIVQTLPSALAVASITGVVIGLRRRFPQLFVGWAWFIVMLIPVIGIVPFGTRSVADRYTYLPAIGLAIIAAWAIAQWAQRRAGAAIVLTAALLAAFATATARQVERWYDTRSLFTATLAATGDNELAKAEILYGRLEEVDRECLAAPGGPATGWAPGASADDFLRRLTPAQRVAYFQSVFANFPDDARPHVKLGGQLAAEADDVDAAAQFDIAVRIDPNDPAAQIGLAKSLMQLHRFADALPHARQAIHLDPNNIEASTALTDCQKRLAEADRVR
jgi:Flp pilus assembly protein TadD